MQRLYVVGFTKDREGLVLSVRKGTKTGAYHVDVDGQFEEVVAELIKERGGEAEPRIPRAESQLSVREMQQRLRGGQSIHQVAKAAGVTDEWVARFAIPIQAEQAQVVRQAFALSMAKQRLGVSNQTLGISVWWNLQDKSVVLEEDGWETGWTAALIRDNRWLVKFEYTARKRRFVAEWEVDLRAGTLTSRGRLATELGYVEAGRRRRPGPPPPLPGGLVTRALPPVVEVPAPVVEPVLEAGEAAPVEEVAPKARRSVKGKTKRAAPKRVAKKATKRPASRTPVAKKAPAKKVAGKATAPKKALAKKSAVKRTAPKKAAPKKVAPKKAAPKKAAAKKATAKKAPPARTPAAKAASRRVGPAPVVTTMVRPTIASAAPRSAPVVSGGMRAGEASVSPNSPTLTPPPGPAASRKRRSFLRR